MDNAVCGGPDTGSGITSTTPPISASALNMVKAAILMGSPRYVAGLTYNVGTCTAQGVSLPLHSTSTSISLRNNPHLTLRVCLVCLPPPRLHLPRQLWLQNPKLLRLARPVLLHGQRPATPPGLRLDIRAASAHLCAQQAQLKHRWWQHNPHNDCVGFDAYFGHG